MPIHLLSLVRPVLHAVHANPFASTRQVEYERPSFILQTDVHCILFYLSLVQLVQGLQL
jgi:hypothetical protein